MMLAADSTCILLAQYICLRFTSRRPCLAIAAVASDSLCRVLV